MRFGLVGVGRIGASHAGVVRDHPRVTELVLADADRERARTVADELGVAAVDQVEELLQRVDALLVTAATSAHADLVVAGVEAGLPVFCEKPVAADLDGHRRVLAAVQAAGTPVQVGFQRRFDAGYAAARTALREGRIGELRRVHLVTADQAPPDPGYIPTSGGIFRDCHIHDFDILRWVTGREVLEVYAVGANRGAAFFAEGGDVDESVAVLVLDDGTLATLQGSRYNGGGHDVRLELAGTSSTWAVGLSDRAPLHAADPGVDFPSGDPWPNYWARFSPAYAAEVEAFIDVAAGRRPTPCSVEDALAAFRVAEAATRSRLEGRVVRLAEVAA